MTKRILRTEQFRQFEEQLRAEEKSPVTIEKYLRDVRAFSEYINGNPITKDAVVSYMLKLIEKGYAPASINASLASLHKLFSFYGWTDCCVKTIKVQRQVYCSAGQELTREEYFRLLQAAKHKPRLRLLLQTIGSTGIMKSKRISQSSLMCWGIQVLIPQGSTLSAQAGNTAGQLSSWGFYYSGTT